MSPLLRLQTRFRSGLLTGLWLGIPYFLLQWINLRPAYPLNYQWEATWIGVHPWATWPYLSYFFLLMITGLSLSDREYQHFILACWIAGLLSFITFLTFPTSIGRDGLEIHSWPPAYHWFTALDQPRNAFPSLHISLSTLCAIGFRHHHPVLLLIIGGWVLLIWWSTLALRQHVWIDVLGGISVAVIASYLTAKLPSHILPRIFGSLDLK